MRGAPHLWGVAVGLALGLTGPASVGADEASPALAGAPRRALPAHAFITPTALSLLQRPVDDALPNAEEVRRGRALVIEADCLSCHLRAGGEPFAGGLGLNTPFGVIYSANITSDRQTGVGERTPESFYRTLHEGIGRRGGHLYPAFPYPWFTRISRSDSDAILAYLKTTPPVRYRPPKTRLPFPLNIRALMRGWNLLFFRAGEFQPVAGRSGAWNRGAYLVNGPGHCGACHTPKNMLGADKGSQAFRGGVIDNWTAPDLTGNARTGLGVWSEQEIADYLGAGRTRRASAGGPMAEVVSLSTSLMSPADRRAIAVYLKSLPPSPEGAAARPDDDAMKRGAAIYADACAACHLDNGIGQPGLFPPLPGNAVAQQRDPTGVLHIVLAGSRVASTAERPSPLTMPSFAWKLTDQEIGDVTTFIRNSWGNRAEPIRSAQVAKLRKTLKLVQPRLTAMSGDHR